MFFFLSLNLYSFVAAPFSMRSFVSPYPAFPRFLLRCSSFSLRLPSLLSLLLSLLRFPLPSFVLPHLPPFVSLSHALLHFPFTYPSSSPLNLPSFVSLSPALLHFPLTCPFSFSLHLPSLVSPLLSLLRLPLTCPSSFPLYFPSFVSP